MTDDERPTFGERLALFDALPPVFTTEQVVEAGVALGYYPFKTFSCLRVYQMDELVVQQGDSFVKRGDRGAG